MYENGCTVERHCSRFSVLLSEAKNLEKKGETTDREQANFVFN